ncbi:MAG: hypothetical protein LW630_02990 [Saprospiraceae bacterium]|jgi:phosphoglycerate dehydrogenase-like enzyme|nr:hypothetical protein [Saprospiraceae bacterium]
MHSERVASSRHVKALSEIAPGFTVHQVADEEDAIECAPEAVYILGHRYLRQVLPYTKKLNWVQLSGGGFDHIPIDKLKALGVLTSRYTGASRGIAFHAVALAMAVNRKLPEIIASQRDHEFDTALYQEMLPLPQKIMIVGLGSIGLEIAKLMRPGCRLIRGVKKSREVIPTEFVDEIFVSDDWKEKLQDTDFLFVCLPNNADTEAFVDEEALKKLPDHAVVVNVGRYETIDNEVMCQLLNTGKLGGAAIDVFPRPFDEILMQRLYTVKNLLISPYVAARYQGKVDEFETFCEKQLQRMIQGITPENIVGIDQ